jgi:hypothetical protein
LADDIIKDALARYDEANSRWSENRILSVNDIKFGRLGDQWPDDIAKKRKADNRPMLTINRIPSFLRQVVNDARQNKPSIKVRPVDSGADLKTAEVIQGLIRNIESTSDADVAYDTAIDNATSCGIGFIRVDVDYAHNDSFDMDILIKPIENVQSVLFDPESKAFDSSDWNYAFVSDMLTPDQFKKKYPKAEMVDFSSWDGTQQWFEQDGVRVAEYWERSEYDRKLLLLSNGMVVDAEAITPQIPMLSAQGVTPTAERMTKGYKIVHRLMTGVEVLKETNWVGSIIPVVPCYGEIVNYEGKRYWRSLFRDATDSQRMLNFWYTAATERMALSPKAPYIANVDAIEGYENIWETANTESYGYLPYKGNAPPQRQQPTDVPYAEMQATNMASDNMKSIMGIYDASLGQRSNETSGRAIMARQREGDTSSFHFIDNLSRSIRCVGRIVVEMIPRVYDKQRVVRVLGEDGKSQMVTVNETQQGPDGIELVLNDLTKGKYDVVVEAGPSYTTRRQEASTAMVDLVRSFPDAAPVLGDLIARSMDWPEAEKVADRLKMLLPAEIRKAEEAKAMEQNGEDAVKSALAQAQSAIAEKDQQLAQIQQAVQGQAAEMSKKEAELQKAMADLDKRINDLKAAQGKLDLSETELALKQKAMQEAVSLAVQKAELRLKELMNERDEASRAVNNGMQADQLKQAEAASRDQILAAALQELTAAVAILNQPKTVSIVGADGKVRTALTQPAPAQVM